MRGLLGGGRRVNQKGKEGINMITIIHMHV
jgi:hypothetical protein